MKIVVTSIIFILLFLCCSISKTASQDMSKLSSDIYKMQMSEFGEIEKNDINDERKLAKLQRDRSQWYKYLNFSSQSDTVFFLQSHDIQGTSNLLVWNSKDTVSFFITSAEESYKPIERNLFPQYLYSLITKWDKEKIKELEKESDNYVILPRLTNYATRVIFRNKKYTIDCVRYKDLIIE